MEKIRFENVSKDFGSGNVLENINLEIEDGELFTFLGPSGCGKTTLLRILAGFEEASQGKVFLGGKDLTNLPPEKRNISMVFQNYALFPNMTVEENVGYGLKLRKYKKEDIEKKVDQYLDMVGMKDYKKRNINQLSGGEQQRVSIARALVIEPNVLLLDEPLSNLDAKLRQEMRAEIRELQRKLKITTIFVTHDQQEAMSISDRIAVFNKGHIIQINRPLELYNKPRNQFVAEFIGKSNIIFKEDYKNFKIGERESSKISIRPQDFIIGEGEIEARIKDLEFIGDSILYTCEVKDREIEVYQSNTSDIEVYNVGDKINLAIRRNGIKDLED